MNWLTKFNEREQRLISNCVNHAKDDPAGLPGHNLILIVAKMAEALDEFEQFGGLFDDEALDDLLGEVEYVGDNPHFGGIL